jgi:hypothetical protein
MAVYQSTYDEAMPVGAAGMIANMELANKITRTANGAIAFGQPVIRSGNHNCAIADEPGLTAVGAAGVPAPVAATITAAPAAVAPAQVGVYTVTAIVGGATTTSRWRVTAPDGSVVGTAIGNTEFVGGGLTFTITDAGTDPVVGETFTITVTSDEAGDLLGLSIRNIALGHTTSPDAYAQYDSVAIMTMGTMWVTAGATVVAGDLVYWDDADSRFTDIVTDYPLIVGGKHARFETGGADGELVMVALR